VTSVSSLPVPFICFQNGNTPLDNAAYNGHVDAMRYLVGRGAKCDEKADVSCCMHPCNVCALTCRRGVGVTSVSSLHVPCICFQDGRTPFHFAALKGHVVVMKYLVELGAKYDEKNDVSCCTHPCIVRVLTCRCVSSISSLPVLHLFSGWPHSFACCCFEGTCGCHEISGRAWCQV
jgi:ankyrin repeat protein